MRIKSIHLLGFGKFINKVIKLNPNFNLILGGNEAGKSTVTNAILGVLYGFKGRKEEVRAMKARYRPWDEKAPYAAGLIININGKDEYYIERNFDEDKVKIEAVVDGHFFPTTMTLEKILRDNLGILNAKIFENTLLIRQEEIAALDHGELGEIITQKITEGAETVNLKNVFKNIEDKWKEFQRGLDRAAKNPGPIKSCQDEINKLEEQINSLKGYQVNSNIVSKEIRIKKARLEEINRRLFEIVPVLEAYQSFKKINDEKSRLLREQQEIQSLLIKIEEKERELKAAREGLMLFQNREGAYTDEVQAKITSLQVRIESLESNLSQVNNKLKQLEEKKLEKNRELEHLKSSIPNYFIVKYNKENLMEAQRFNKLFQETQELLAQKEDELLQYETASQRPKSKVLLLWAGLLMGILSLGGLFYFKQIWGYLLSVVFASLGAIFVYLSRDSGPKTEVASQLKKNTVEEIERLKANLNNYRRMLLGLLGEDTLETFQNKVYDLLQKERDAMVLENELNNLDSSYLKEEKEILTAQLNECREKMAELLAVAGAVTAAEYLERLARFKKINEDVRVAKEAIDLLKGQRNIDELKENLTALSVSVLNLTRQQEQLNVSISEQEYNLLLTQRISLEEEARNLKEELFKLEIHMDHYKNTIPTDIDLWEMENQLAEKKLELKDLELQKKGLEKALVILEEAASEAQTQMAPKVKERVNQIFSGITMGRYRDVMIKIEDRGLRFKVKVPEINEYVEIDHLSSGTRDQLYLALRFALSEYLSRKPEFPIFCDDPFVNFDDERLKHAINILGALSKEHQVILLTKERNIENYIPESQVVNL